MSTTTQQDSGTQPVTGVTLHPNHSSEHNSATANDSSQVNGNVYNNSLSINTHHYGGFAGNLDSFVPPLSSIHQAGNRRPVPSDHDNTPPDRETAKRQIRQINESRYRPAASPRPVNTPSASLQRSKHKNRGCRSEIVGIPVGKVSSWALIVAVSTLFMMLVLNTRHGSPEQTRYVRHGFLKSWLDHSYPGIWQRRVTLSDNQAQWVTCSVIFILALSLPSAYTLLHRICARILDLIIHLIPEKEDNSDTSNRALPLEQEDDHNQQHHEQTPLLGRHQNQGRHPKTRQQQKQGLWVRILDVWASSGSLYSSVLGLVKLLSNQNNYSFLGQALVMTVVLFLAIADIVLFLGLSVSTILSANIATDATVLSEHPECGLWLQDPTVPNANPAGFDYLQEVEAGEYAKKCYHSDPRADGCNNFLTQNIPYNKYSSSKCPFEESLCMEGKSSAYTLETGPISSRYLGINVEIGYTINRRITCSPIQQRAAISQDGKSYEYDYGPSGEFGNFTWASPAKTSWEFGGYNVATFFHELGSLHNTWRPSPDFKPSTHESITLLLIQSQKNYFASPRHDPIFPAEHSVPPSLGNPPLYFNDNPVATALACVYTTEICDASGTTCFADITRPEPELDTHDEIVGYYMLLISLVKSNVFDAIKLLGGRALIAEAKLQRQFSLPLAKEQWKVEVDHLFEAALVRPQISLRDFIRGTAANESDYVDRTDSSMRDMCRSYKFPGQGWKNFTVWGMVILVVIVVGIFMLTIEVSGSPLATHNCDEESSCGYDDHEEHGDKQTIMLAEKIFPSASIETPVRAQNGNRALHQRAVSRNGADVERANPRAFMSGGGPSHEVNPAPNVPETP